MLGAVKHLLLCLLALFVALPAYAQDEGDAEKKMTPEEELAWLLKDGPVHLKTRSWHAASRCYARAVQLDPKNYTARFGLATAYTRLENYRAALEHVTWCTKAQPANDAALLLMGELQLALKKFKDAKKSLTQLQQRAPKTPGLSRMLGRLAYKEGDYEVALPLLEDATFGTNADAAIHFELGECLYRMGRFADSMQKFNLVEQRLKGNANRKTLYLKAERRLAQSRARQRQYGNLINDGLTFEDVTRKVKATKSVDRAWAWVWPTKTESLVCGLALPDDEIVITVEMFGEKGRVKVGRQYASADQAGKLRKLTDQDFVLTHKKVRGFPAAPARTPDAKAVSTCLKGDPKKGGATIVQQTTFLTTQDALFRVVIKGKPGAMKQHRKALGDFFKALELPR